MADIGELVGSMMCGLITARKMADEQTASLAEYYRTNPLLEGLSVPRIRIPELTIDIPMLIENFAAGEEGKTDSPENITPKAEAALGEILSKHNIKVTPAFKKNFKDELQKRLTAINKPGTPVVQETIIRKIQDTFSDVLEKENITVTAKEKQAVANHLRESLSPVVISKEAVSSKVRANIRTADVKEQSSSNNVVRLKITMKEEGLEWAVKSSESGGVVRTLEPE